MIIIKPFILKEKWREYVEVRKVSPQRNRINK